MIYAVAAKQLDDPETAYPAISFNLAAVEKRSIHIHSFVVKWKVLNRELRQLAEMRFDHFDPPITYLAKSSHAKNLTEATRTIDGDIVDGLVRFTTANPIAKCRLEFEGDPGLYLVSVEVEVQDDKSKHKEILKNKNPVCVIIPKPRKD